MNSSKVNSRAVLAVRMNKKRAAQMLEEFVRAKDFRAWEEYWRGRTTVIVPILIRSPSSQQEDMRRIWSGELPAEECARIIGESLRLGDRQAYEWSSPVPVKDDSGNYVRFDYYAKQDNLEGPSVTIDWEAGQVAIIPQTLDDLLWNALLQNSRRLAICDNPECSRKYFLRYRTQRFCRTRCAAPTQREHKRRWWNEHGNRWRQRKQ